jgi:hypothetical protein
MNAVMAATSVDGGGLPWPVIIGALVPFILLAFARADASTNLRKAERLTEIAMKMAVSSERTLIEDLRDDYIVEWVLRERMPRQVKARNWAYFLFGSGCLALAAWLVLALLHLQSTGTNVAYGLSIILISLGYWVQTHRQTSQTKWMDEERGRRWIRPAMTAGA